MKYALRDRLAAAWRILMEQSDEPSELRILMQDQIAAHRESLHLDLSRILQSMEKTIEASGARVDGLLEEIRAVSTAMDEVTQRLAALERRPDTRCIGCPFAEEHARA